MATVERFEELKVWQAARDVVNAVYKASSSGAFARDYALPRGIYDSGVIPRGERDQIRRAAISIPSNIVHPVKYMGWTISRGRGFSRHSNKEFIQFLFIFYPVKYMRWILLHGAGGSAAEVQSQLYTALDQGYISQREFDKIYGQTEVVARQISRFITYLKGAG